MREMDIVKAEIASCPPFTWEKDRRGANAIVQFLSSVAWDACSVIRAVEESELDVFESGILPSHHGMGWMTSFHGAVCSRFDARVGILGRSIDASAFRGTCIEDVKCISRRVMRSK